MYLKINEIFILVPALLGLKGNLEMTLASRLSTAVSYVCEREEREERERGGGEKGKREREGGGGREKADGCSCAACLCLTVVIPVHISGKRRSLRRLVLLLAFDLGQSVTHSGNPT